MEHKQRKFPLGVAAVVIILLALIGASVQTKGQVVPWDGVEPTRTSNGEGLFWRDIEGKTSLVLAKEFSPGDTAKFGETLYTVTEDYTWKAQFKRGVGLDISVEGSQGTHIAVAEVVHVLEAHLTVKLKRAGTDEWIVLKDGVLIDNAGTVTTIGLNWIEDQMGDSPAGDPAKWISLSNDAGAPAAGWTQIPVEIAANGLTRAAGTYASTGNGVWTITHTFTASGAQSAQLAGLNWAAAGDGNLLCADTFASADLLLNDELTMQWTITVT